MLDEEKVRDPHEFSGVDIKHFGSKLILPAEPKPEMGLREAINFLEAKEEEREQMVALIEDVDAYPWDGAYAMSLAIRERFGWAKHTETLQTLFGPVSVPPSIHRIEVGPGEYGDMAWGDFELPNVDGKVSTKVKKRHGRVTLQLVARVKRKHAHIIKDLANLTRKLVREQSIYRGKPILLPMSDGQLDLENPPRFVDVSDVDHSRLVFNRDLEEEIATNLFAPVRYSEACRRARVPLSRGVLLEGPFGTGKTMVAHVLAKVCKESGWTFIIVPKAASINEAVDFATAYQPAVVFAEDIDRAISGERTESMDEILNIVDGVTTKGLEIMVVLTTNAVDDINQAMLRPGRLDAVISVKTPDAEAAQRLIRAYAGPLLSQDEDIASAGAELAGQIPSTIREAVERSKLFALHQSNGTSALITCDALVSAAKSMKNHLELLHRERKTPTYGEMFAESLVGMLTDHGHLSEALKSNGGILTEAQEDAIQEIRDAL